MSPPDLWSLLDALHAEAAAQPEIANAPAPLREGRAFAYVLEHLPVGMTQEVELAGEFGWRFCSPPERARLEQWLSKRRQSDGGQGTDRVAFDRMSDWFFTRPSEGGQAHTTVDYERVVHEGIEGILSEVEAELPAADETKRNYLLGMRAALDGLVLWAGRYAELADELAQATDDPLAAVRLAEIAESCRRVPSHPARSVKEAMQAIWFTHLGVGLSERSDASLSLGRLDQYLYPLYKHDRASGVSEAEIRAAIRGFFRALNTFGDPACAVNLGGRGADGRDLFNPLSRLIVEVAVQLHLPSPLLAARVHNGMPSEVFDLLTDPALLEMGQPSFYGETPCQHTLRRRGVAGKDTPAWCVNSCMGLMMPGQEWTNMWGTVVNTLLSLELALNRGQPFCHELPLPLSTKSPRQYDSFEPLFETVCAYLTELADAMIDETVARTERRGRERPNPFVSALLRDCIPRGLDRLLGGCRYHTVTVEGFGLVNTADALLAIQRLVFESGRYTLDELVQAAKSDFEHRPDILTAIRRVPKYGNGQPEADGMARRLAARFAGAVARRSTDNVCFAPSFHTLSAHIPAGKILGASLDGRRAGEPLAKNVGAGPGRSVDGCTALMRSATAIDQTAFTGGQALDISVDLRPLRRTENRRKFQALLKTYFRLGGLQVQVNGVSPATLRSAMADPESHRDVLVRKAGYSTRYVTLSMDEQKELVARFEAGL